MELEIYESELADYSLQDSPFYEANTPIIFGLTAAQNLFASTNTATMVDALNLSSKKSSMMMSTKCQSLKLAYECTANGSDGIGKTNVGLQFNNSSESPSKKRCDSTDRFYLTKTMDLDANATETAMNQQPKKKRKCVSFLPNYVQVSQLFYLIRLYVWAHRTRFFFSHALSARHVPSCTDGRLWCEWSQCQFD